MGDSSKIGLEELSRNETRTNTAAADSLSFATLLQVSIRSDIPAKSENNEKVVAHDEKDERNNARCQRHYQSAKECKEAHYKRRERLCNFYFIFYFLKIVYFSLAKIPFPSP